MITTNTSAALAGSLMRAEINEQQSAFERWSDTGSLVTADLVESIRKFQPSMVLTVARGTSDRAADYGKYLLEILLGIPVGSTSPSTVTLFGASPRSHGVLALAISQSGESPDIIAEARALRAGGAFVVAITNSPNSPLASCSNAVIDIAAGRENAVAATKSFTAECAALADLSFALADRPLDRRAIAQAVTRAINSPLPSEAAGLLGESVGRAKFLICIGRGPSSPIASEGALKIMETSGMPALSYSAADFAHGPRTLVTAKVPVIIVVPPGKFGDSMTELINDISDADAPLVVLADCHRAHFTIPTQLTDPLTAPIEQVISLQRIALDLALHLGCDPDNPPALTKVTRTL
jgi:glutamine---fructose-6-phosphate transaminase (isomerizing)